MSALGRLTRYLDRELHIDAFEDTSHNGLQVENDGRVRRVACGVDASMECFEEAKRRGADLVVCHHGLSWGDSLKRITDRNYRLIRFLIENHMALYACHLPLDAHRKHGNNALLCRVLGVRQLKAFGRYKGVEIGFQGQLSRRVSYRSFRDEVIRTVARGHVRSMDFGPKRVRSVAVVSGGAADQVAQAGEAGVDVFVTGEPCLSAYSAAQEYGVNVVFAGHYATERFGVCALGRLLRREFRLPWEFIDLNVPY